MLAQMSDYLNSTLWLSAIKNAEYECISAKKYVETWLCYLRAGYTPPACIATTNPDGTLRWALEVALVLHEAANAGAARRQSGELAPVEYCDGWRLASMSVPLS